VLHAGAVLSDADEQRFLAEGAARAPYGVVLWPAAIALAHDVASRDARMEGLRVLELGGGTGLPGLVAAALGARVTITDRNDAALSLCRRNGERNQLRGIEYRPGDWTSWAIDARHDLILGSDILYATRLHPHLQEIFRDCLTPCGRVLLSDPFRPTSIALLEGMEQAGWSIALAKWVVGEQEGTPRAIGVYELAPPA
jgi:predicted nicotinamide N-methyase